MSQDYSFWIMDQGFHDPNFAMAKCIKACADMKKEFPELTEHNGVVWSRDNRDNFGDSIKEYPHRWLKDSRGNIIDPTKSQYCLLGDLEYKEFDLSKGMSRCHGCGQYFEGHDEYFCGCKWSKE